MKAKTFGKMQEKERRKNNETKRRQDKKKAKAEKSKADGLVAGGLFDCRLNDEETFSLLCGEARIAYPPEVRRASE